MKLCLIVSCICFLLTVYAVKSEEVPFVKGNTTEITQTRVPRQTEYLSLISTLLQQTSVLSSVDGVLLAFSTIAASALSRSKPLLVAGFMSYLIYAGTALLAPETVARMGIVPHRGARSVTGGLVAEALMRSIQFSPVMSVITNVTVNVVTDTASRIRRFAGRLANELRFVQGRVATWSLALQSTCMERFLCRVGRFTQDTFPTVASALRTIGNTSGLDSFAVAMIRGTSTGNCSLIYPDCTL